MARKDKGLVILSFFDGIGVLAYAIAHHLGVPISKYVFLPHITSTR